MQFLKDPIKISFERSVFGFLELTGNIGGVFEILSIIGGFLIGGFSGKMFLYSILSKLYQVQEPEDRNINDSNILFLTFKL